MKTSVYWIVAALGLTLATQDLDAREGRDSEVKARSSHSSQVRDSRHRDSNVSHRVDNRHDYRNSKPSKDVSPPKQSNRHNLVRDSNHHRLESPNRHGEVREGTDHKLRVTESRRLRHSDDSKHNTTRVEHRREWQKDKQRHVVDKYRHFDSNRHSWHRNRLHRWREHYHHSHHYRHYHRHGYYYRPYRNHYVTVHTHYPVWVYDYYYDYLDEHHHDHHCPHWHFDANWEDIAFGVIVSALLFD
jgi:hypothetical protein